jgi:AAA domain
MELRDVFWIGGAPGAGKSTIARRLAERYGLRLYVTDDVMGDHARRISAVEAPHLQRFQAMDMDERWLNRSPQEMLETFHWFRGEGFRLIVEDLRAMTGPTPIVAEGFRLLPHLVMPIAGPKRVGPERTGPERTAPERTGPERTGPERTGPKRAGQRAIWLLPTPQFHRAALDARGSTWAIPNGTSDPPRARWNLEERNRLFTDRLARETERTGAPTLWLDGTLTEAETLDRVADRLGLSARAG